MNKHKTLCDTVLACAKSAAIIGIAQHIIAPERLHSIYEDITSSNPIQYAKAAVDTILPFIPPIALTLYGIYKGRKQQKQIDEEAKKHT